MNVQRDNAIKSEQDIRSRKRLLWLRGATLLAVGLLALRVFSLAQDNDHGILLFGSTQSAGTIRSGNDIHGEVMAFSFRLMPVSIAGIPHCGCTVTEAYDHTLLPFGLVSIPLTVSTEGMEVGPQTRTLALRFTSGKTTWQRDATIHFRLTK